MQARYGKRWKRPTKHAPRMVRDWPSGLPAACWPKELRAAQGQPQAYRGTTHISVIDGEGNAAAVSLSNGEGNGYIVGRFGFMLNNMLGEEDLAAGSLQAWREGVRLSSMMAPTIILQPDGTVTALGTGGSNRIRTAILQVAVNLLDRSMSSGGRRRSTAPACGEMRHGQLRAGTARGGEGRVPCTRRPGACLARTQSVLRRRACRAAKCQRRGGGRWRSAAAGRGDHRVGLPGASPQVRGCLRAGCALAAQESPRPSRPGQAAGRACRAP